MARRIKVACLMAVAVCCSAIPLLAHHSFGAEYDANKPITLTGVVTKVEWTNPHTHFYLDVTDGKGGRDQLEVRRLQPRRAVPDRLEERHHSEAGRHDHCLRVARAGRRQLGAFARDHLTGREEAVLRAPFRYRRRRKCSSRGGAMMRAFGVAAVLVISLSPLSACSQTSPGSDPLILRLRRRQAALFPGPRTGSRTDGSVAGRHHLARDVGGSQRRRRRRRQRARSLGARGPVLERPAGRTRSRPRTSPGRPRRFSRRSTGEASTIQPDSACRPGYRAS